MSRTTRERRRSIPVSVRFADEPALVQVIGPMEPIRRVSWIHLVKKIYYIFKLFPFQISLNFLLKLLARLQ